MEWAKLFAHGSYHLRQNVENTVAKRKDVDVKTDKNNISLIVMNLADKQIAYSTFLLLTLAAIETPASAFQVDITSVDTTFIDGSPTTAGGITYGGDQLRVDTFEANGITWRSSQPSSLTIRRHTPDPNPNNVDSDFVVWIEQNTSDTDLKGPRPNSTEEALQSNNLYLGTDNVFVNYGNNSDNDSNIERLDYVFDSPVTASNQVGITVFERGSNNAHDSFEIALIIGVDGSNTPTGYSDVINVSSGWGATNLEEGNPSRSILNDSANPGTLAVSDTTAQDIGGVMFSLDEFTGVNGSDIYGYSIFGGDVDSNSPTLTDWTTYPSSAVDTTEGSVGLDPLGVNLGLVEEVPFEFSPSLGLIISGITIGISQWAKNKHLKKKSL